jgi:hypothetical protein
MENFLLKMKEYNSFVTGSWFVAEVLEAVGFIKVKDLQ